MTAYNAHMTTIELTTKQAAEVLGVSARTIQAWHEKGEFPHAYKLNPSNKRNSPLRIPRLDIEAIIERRAEAASGR